MEEFLCQQKNLCIRIGGQEPLREWPVLLRSIVISPTIWKVDRKGDRDSTQVQIDQLKQGLRQGLAWLRNEPFGRPVVPA